MRREVCWAHVTPGHQGEFYDYPHHKSPQVSVDPAPPSVGALTGSEPPDPFLSSLLWAEQRLPPAVSGWELWGGEEGEQGALWGMNPLPSLHTGPAHHQRTSLQPSGAEGSRSCWAPGEL